VTKPYSPACDRNRDAILAVLREHFADRRRVLEFGSGTGQHAVYFAAALSHLGWQASDVPAHLPGIREWIGEAALPNTPAPLPIDVNDEPVPADYDAVFTANTMHIMSWPEVRRFFAALPVVTSAQALLTVYGPFKYRGQFTSPSNAMFDQSLRADDPRRGIRDFEAVDELARAQGLVLVEDREMPANNRCLTWRRNLKFDTLAPSP
jgi:Protein of unknown function (DUF938)